MTDISWVSPNGKRYRLLDDTVYFWGMDLSGSEEWVIASAGEAMEALRWRIAENAREQTAEREAIVRYLRRSATHQILDEECNALLALSDEIERGHHHGTTSDSTTSSE